MRTISKVKIVENASYYERIFVLSELANLSYREIAAKTAKDKTPPQIRSDIKRLKQTIDENGLPEQYKSDFNDILGMRNQLENLLDSEISGDFRWKELTHEQQKEVSTQVNFSVSADQELGFSTDNATAWFYRRLYTSRIKRRFV